MKYKMLALIVALTVISWAQTETQTAPATPQQSTAPADMAKCACCDKMAAGDMKDMKSCCTHHHMQAKDGQSTEMASCCGGKDAKSCMRKSKDKTAASCCKEGCSKEGCGKEKTAADCCG